MPNIEAFNKLIEILESVPDTELDLASWRCGTTACVIGHAAYDPWFNKMGFRMVLCCVNVPEYVTETNRLSGWAAVDTFFDITDDESAFLFTLDAYITKKELMEICDKQQNEGKLSKFSVIRRAQQERNIRQLVIDRLREFVKKHQLGVE